MNKIPVRFLMRLATLLAVVLLLTACSKREVPLRQLSDHDLAESYGFCLDRKPTAPGKAQACANLKRECERRKQDLGTYICRHR